MNLLLILMILLFCHVYIYSRSMYIRLIYFTVCVSNAIIYKFSFTNEKLLPLFLLGDGFVFWLVLINFHSITTCFIWKKYKQQKYYQTFYSNRYYDYEYINSITEYWITPCDIIKTFYYVFYLTIYRET